MIAQNSNVNINYIQNRNQLYQIVIRKIIIKNLIILWIEMFILDSNKLFQEKTIIDYSDNNHYKEYDNYSNSLNIYTFIKFFNFLQD